MKAVDDAGTTSAASSEEAAAIVDSALDWSVSAVLLNVHLVDPEGDPVPRFLDLMRVRIPVHVHEELAGFLRSPAPARKRPLCWERERRCLPYVHI